MKYSLSWSDRAKKEMGNLPEPVAKRIYTKVGSIRDNPSRTVERCTGYPYFHQRVGSYRAILDIDDAALLIRVHSVGPRKKVYDR